MRNQINENNFMWKGDEVGYGALHAWVRTRKPRPEHCERCIIKPPKHLANISGEYRRDIDDFQWLCVQCHADTDVQRKQRISEKSKGENNPMYGKHHTEEAKKKIRDSRLSTEGSEAQRIAVAKSNASRGCSDETRERHRQSAKLQWANKRALK